MEKKDNLFFKDSYLDHLKFINGLKFTPREIDIISFLISGRSAKKIASFFGISPKTVENHTHNIMEKLGCNSRERIIDFIEKSEKLPLIRKHYSKTLLNRSFEDCLKKIANVNKNNNKVCIFSYEEKDRESTHLISYLTDFMAFAGINLLPQLRNKNNTLTRFFNEANENQSVIYLISKNNLEQVEHFLARANETSLPLKSNDKILFLLPKGEKKQDLLKTSSQVKVLDLEKINNEYFFIFEILSKILDVNLDKMILEFKEHHENSHADVLSIYKQQHINDETFKKKKNDNKLSLFFQKPKSWMSLLFLFILGGVCLKLSNLNLFPQREILEDQETEKSSIRSDLVLPTEAAFLNRSELLSQMDKTFKKQTGIRTLALVGIGGAGKTTLARHYARGQKTNVVWELNAETPESLYSSFERFAHVLAIGEEDLAALSLIQKIKDPVLQEEKLIHFVKTHLKSSDDWFLIYDNVTHFKDIQHYFPNDPTVWGNGRVLISTRNTNIKNNKFISHTIDINELNKKQKLDLFSQIVTEGNKSLLTSSQQQAATDFLERIPSFPLDVSLAAFYLRSTQIPYQQYLDNLEIHNEGFEKIQKNILLDSGDYVKTRFGILAYTLEQILKKDKDYKDLLIFISLLDPLNIPKDLLIQYKGKETAENFIYDLKNYSLITVSDLNPQKKFSVFSLHRSTQKIMKDYLIMNSHISKDTRHFELFLAPLDQYIKHAIDVEDLTKLKNILKHNERLIGYGDVFPEKMRGYLYVNAGSIYYYLSDHSKAKEALEKGLLQLTHSFGEGSPKTHYALIFLAGTYREKGETLKAKEMLEKVLGLCNTSHLSKSPNRALALVHLGAAYRVVGEHKKSLDAFQEALNIYKQNLPENDVKVAWVLGHVGNAYGKLGHYAKAKYFLEQSLIHYRKHFSDNHRGIIQGFGYLGEVYMGIHEYEKAKKCFEYSFHLSKQFFPEAMHTRTNKLIFLGNIHRNLNQLTRARELLEKGLAALPKYFPKNSHYIGRANLYLSDLYAAFGDTKKAKEFANKGYKIFQDHYGKDNIETGRALYTLAKVSFYENDLEKARHILISALNIFDKSEHPDAYLILEDLAAISLKQAESSKNDRDKQTYKRQTLSYLQQAQDIVKANFPVDSPYLKRIHSKITYISGGSN